MVGRDSESRRFCGSLLRVNGKVRLRAGCSTCLRHHVVGRPVGRPMERHLHRAGRAGHGGQPALAGRLANLSTRYQRTPPTSPRKELWACAHGHLLPRRMVVDSKRAAELLEQAIELDSDSARPMPPPVRGHKPPSRSSRTDVSVRRAVATRRGVLLISIRRSPRRPRSWDGSCPLRLGASGEVVSRVTRVRAKSTESTASIATRWSWPTMDGSMKYRELIGTGARPDIGPRYSGQGLDPHPAGSATRNASPWPRDVGADPHTPAVHTSRTCA